MCEHFLNSLTVCSRLPVSQKTEKNIPEDMIRKVMISLKLHIDLLSTITPGRSYFYSTHVSFHNAASTQFNIVMPVSINENLNYFQGGVAFKGHSKSFSVYMQPNLYETFIKGQCFYKQ